MRAISGRPLVVRRYWSSRTSISKRALGSYRVAMMVILLSENCNRGSLFDDGGISLAEGGGRSASGSIPLPADPSLGAERYDLHHVDCDWRHPRLARQH